MNFGYERVGNHIERALRKKGKPQTWLAEQLDVHKSHVNKWVKGKIKPSTQYLEAISHALGYSVEEIVSGNFKDEAQYKKVESMQNDVRHHELELMERYLSKIINAKSERERESYKFRALSLFKMVLEES